MSKQNFNEVCIFQVKPSKTVEFEALMCQVIPFLKSLNGTKEVRMMIRNFTFNAKHDIKNAEPAREISRIVKSVKYVLYWVLSDEVKHGEATKLLFERYNKDISKLLICPADKYLGKELSI